MTLVVQSGNHEGLKHDEAMEKSRNKKRSTGKQEKTERLPLRLKMSLMLQSGNHEDLKA